MRGYIRSIVKEKWKFSFQQIITFLIKNMLTTKKKNTISKKRNSQQNEAGEKLILNAHRQIKQIKSKLLNLGFSERALEDLQNIESKESELYLHRLAAWELSIWYADQHSEVSARKCINLLQIAVQVENSPTFLRQTAIIEAECQERLGNIEAAKLVISTLLAESSHADLFFAAANLESSLTARVGWINKVMKMYGLAEIFLNPSSNRPAYDCLKTNIAFGEHIQLPESNLKVSVIMPVYNAINVIRTAMHSVLSQTWKNIEVLIVDDCSNDGTSDIIKEYMSIDDRIRLIRAKTNGGTYVARNLALQVATGDFVTCHDADDWSHPEKIEKQVLHLLQNPLVLGNTSNQSRLTNDLKFYRRKQQRFYIIPNLSSLMFRRIQVLESIGYWDSVRFGADSEFIRRIKKVFGEKSIENIPIPLSFPRQSNSSLTENKTFGYHGYFFGARKEYLESFNHFHTIANNLRFDFPQKSRPFNVPEPMWPIREIRNSKIRHFDVIIASDFTLTGGTTSSNIEEIKAQKLMGLRTGLIQLYRYQGNPERTINPKIRALLDGNQVQIIVYGEKVTCDALIVRHPPVLQEWQEYLPNVKASNVYVIVNQTPKRDYGKEDTFVYDIKRCEEHLQRYFGKAGVWFPIGPLVRKVLQEHHSKDLHYINLSSKDWTNIIAVEEWRRVARPLHGSKTRIGRHSRDQYVKWPNDPNELLTIYPDSNDYEIHVLGGAKVPKKVLGYIPKNWNVMEFDQIEPKEFLSTLDVFVYYVHPDWIEAFGRVIFEAIAVGVPVIIPPCYKKLFGEAAIYAEACEVKAKISELMRNNSYYELHVENARNYVEKHFGYATHKSRIRESMSLSQHIKG
ncbi:glycosyltransferase [Paenibacillus polymyxa]|uniref:glycosyltransferase n=1 Tax=Paenibacillus polymyxa TaxID=1406 RepID=UPI003216A2CF